MNHGRPAILGGRPQFSELLPIVRPALPPFSDLQAAFARVLETGILTKGEFLSRFEGALAEAVHTEEAVCVSSGTAGLVLLIKALGTRGDVLLPSFTFMATGHAVLWNGLTPVFCDIDPVTWNVDPGDLERRICDRTGLIIGVHTFGNPAAVDKLQSIADHYRVPLIFDSAHGFGSLWAGQPVGQFGIAEVFSLSPTKVLVAGEGGVVTTNDRALAATLRQLRDYGNRGDYDCDMYGLNARMCEFQAILGRGSLGMVERGVTHRNQLVEVMRARLSELPGIEFQYVRSEDRSTYKDFSIKVIEQKCGLTRDMVAAVLRVEGVDTRPYFDPPLHRMKCYRTYGYSETLPVTEELSASALTLPLYSDMDVVTALGITEAITRVWNYRGDVRSAGESGDWFV